MKSSAEIHYKIAWRSRGNFPGHHPSQQPGSGLQFRNHVPLINAPDPRRFDLRASLRDPFEQVQVKVFQQSSSIPVFVIADLSASMGYSGEHVKTEVLADFVECLSYSAYRTGDTFGFFGCADPDFAPMRLVPTFNRAAGANLAEELRTIRRNGSNSDALVQAADFVGSRRALVFLVSDFHFPLDQLEKLLNALAYHDVVPVVLWDRREYERLPNFGIARVIDPETNQSRMLLMRSSLKRRIKQAFAARKQQLTDMFTYHGREPLVLLDGFNADDVSRYFLG